MTSAVPPVPVAPTAVVAPEDPDDIVVVPPAAAADCVAAAAAAAFEAAACTLASAATAATAGVQAERSCSGAVGRYPLPRRHCCRMRNRGPCHLRDPSRLHETLATSSTAPQQTTCTYSAQQKGSPRASPAAAIEFPTPVGSAPGAPPARLPEVPLLMTVVEAGGATGATTAAGASTAGVARLAVRPLSPSASDEPAAEAADALGMGGSPHLTFRDCTFCSTRQDRDVR